jgi:hypothetical protein
LAGETEVLGENLPQRHFCPSQNPTWPDPGLNPGRRCGKPVTNRLSYDAAYNSVKLDSVCERWIWNEVKRPSHELFYFTVTVIFRRDWRKQRICSIRITYWQIIEACPHPRIRRNLITQPPIFIVKLRNEYSVPREFNWRGLDTSSS